MVFGIAISRERSYLISMPFLLTYIDRRIAKFSRQQNPDWPIQISRSPALSKDISTIKGSNGIHWSGIREKRLNFQGIKETCYPLCPSSPLPPLPPLPRLLVEHCTGITRITDVWVPFKPECFLAFILQLLKLCVYLQWSIIPSWAPLSPWKFWPETVGGNVWSPSNFG